jgi:dienelactone hydrolase
MRSVVAAMTVEVIPTPHGQMPTYVAAPAATGPWPGVVVVHDFAGMSHDLRNQADWLAGEGYLAAAPDLYYWGSRLRCLWTIMRVPSPNTDSAAAIIRSPPPGQAASISAQDPPDRIR